MIRKIIVSECPAWVIIMSVALVIFPFKFGVLSTLKTGMVFSRFLVRSPCCYTICLSTKHPSALESISADSEKES